MKGNFLLPTSAWESIKALSDEDAGKLIKAVFDYVKTGDYTIEGPLVAFFIQLRQEIDKNNAKYQAKIKNLQRNVESSKNSAEKKEDEDVTQDDSTSKIAEIDTNLEQEQNECVEIDAKSEQERNEIDCGARHNTYIHNINNLDNIDILNNSNNLKERNNKRKKSASKGQSKESESIYKQIVNYLNEKAGTNYRATSKKTKELIDARLNEKYSLEHFLKVIDNKCAEWKDTQMEVFLRPSTLFGSKFDEYLNQKNNSSSKAQNSSKNQHQAKVPDWMNNKSALKSEDMSKEELEELEDLYKDFKQVQLDDSGKLTEGELPF